MSALASVAIEYGGYFLLRVVRGRVAATPFQQAFFRAGHAHAAVGGLLHEYEAAA